MVRGIAFSRKILERHWEVLARNVCDAGDFFLGRRWGLSVARSPLARRIAFCLLEWLFDLRERGLAGSFDLERMFCSRRRDVASLFDHFEIRVPFTFSSLAAFLALLERSDFLVKFDRVGGDSLVYADGMGVRVYWIKDYSLARRLCVGSGWCACLDFSGAVFLNYVYGLRRRTFYYVEHLSSGGRIDRFMLHAMEGGDLKVTFWGENVDRDVSAEWLIRSFPGLDGAFRAGVFAHRKNGLIEKMNFFFADLRRDECASSVRAKVIYSVYDEFLAKILSEWALVKRRVSVAAMVRRYGESGGFFRKRVDVDIFNKRRIDWDFFISSKNVFELVDRLAERPEKLEKDSFFYRRIGLILSNAKRHSFPAERWMDPRFPFHVLRFVENALVLAESDARVFEFLDYYVASYFFAARIDRDVCDIAKRSYPFFYERYLKERNEKVANVILEKKRKFGFFGGDGSSHADLDR